MSKRGMEQGNRNCHRCNQSFTGNDDTSSLTQSQYKVKAKDFVRVCQQRGKNIQLSHFLNVSE